jgi:hypothetical protein
LRGNASSASGETAMNKRSITTACRDSLLHPVARAPSVPCAIMQTHVYNVRVAPVPDLNQLLLIESPLLEQFLTTVSPQHTCRGLDGRVVRKDNETSGHVGVPSLLPQCFRQCFPALELITIDPRSRF